MIRRLGAAFTAFFRAAMPDPFVLALVLTGVVFALALGLTPAGPRQALEAWAGADGLFGILAFTSQMVLMLVTGHALAEAPVVQRLLARLAGLPQSGASAAAWVAAVAVGASLLNWGLGLIVGALMARETGRSARARGVRIHYPLLAAAGYTGMMTWHGGLSGSAPLKMTQAKDVVEVLGPELARAVGEIPLTRTTFSATNLLATGGLVVLVPALCAWLAPREGEPCVAAPEELEGVSGRDAGGVARAADGSAASDPAVGARGAGTEGEVASLPERLERSPWFAAVVALWLSAGLALTVAKQGLGRLDPNAVNLAFLTVGLALHGSVRRYTRAVETAAGGAAGIILQFPFYAGIMGVMRGTGLAEVFAQWIVAGVPAEWLSVFTFYAAAVLNVFIPSGGGQWAVQGPIAIRAALAAGVAPETAVMAVAYGDQLTNMLQPFWALPLLAITRTRARDLIGYTALLMLLTTPWLTLILWGTGSPSPTP